MVDETEGPTGVRIGLIGLGIMVLFPLLLMLVAVPLLGGLNLWNGPGSSLSPTMGVGIAVFSLAVLGGVGLLLYRAISDSVRHRSVAIEDLQMAHAKGDVTDEQFEEIKRELDAPDDDS